MICSSLKLSANACGAANIKNIVKEDSKITLLEKINKI